MSKPFLALHILAKNIEREISTLLPDNLFSFLIEPFGDPMWHEGCPEVGQSAWTANLIWPQQELMPATHRAISAILRRWQKNVDIGVTKS
jgi:hypothetical protein